MPPRRPGCPKGQMNLGRETLGEIVMAVEQRKNWRELCSAALDAKDPDELLQIVQELNKVLKHEEQVRQDFRHAMKTAESSSEIRS
jgi:hypothetical protein